MEKLYNDFMNNIIKDATKSCRATIRKEYTEKIKTLNTEVKILQVKLNKSLKSVAFIEMERDELEEILEDAEEALAAVNEAGKEAGRNLLVFKKKFAEAKKKKGKK